MRAKIEFSDADVQRAFAAMDPKTFRTAVKNGLRRTANIIKKQAVSNYKAAYPGGPKRPASERYRGIHMKVWRNGMGAMVDLIFLKGDDALRPWVLRFQNKGTAMRVTKDGWDRGFMPASNFFSDAVEAKKSQAENDLARLVDEAVVKKARKEGLV